MVVRHLARVRAYSYIRFSSPAQAAGDSLRRQTERAEAYCKRRGLDARHQHDVARPRRAGVPR